MAVGILLDRVRGDKKADLVLKNCRILDVFNCRVYSDDLAISEGIIIGPGNYQGEQEIDLAGRYLVPGFIDGHLHLESAMVRVDELARLALSRGTTTVVADPHEIANVAGLTGIRYLLNRGRRLAWNFHLMLPSCVPATSLESSGARLEAEDLAELLEEPGVFGLGEVMDYPAVIAGDKNMLAKLELARNRFIDGHAPGVSGKELNAYLLAGIQADHECTTAAEALEKSALGIYIMIRQGSVTRDLEALLPAVRPENNDRFLFATDDREPEDLLQEGQLDYAVKLAIANGMSPLLAYRLATLNAARALGFGDLGAIAPGRKADLLVLNDLEKVSIEMVFKDGRLLYREGSWLEPLAVSEPDDGLEAKITSTVNLPELKPENFRLPTGRKYRVITLKEDQIITGQQFVYRLEGESQADFLKRTGTLLLAVVERHRASGKIGLGLVKGFKLRSGALASSVAHDSHNLIAAGKTPEDLLVAFQALKDSQGGQLVVESGEVKAKLPLPIAGLMAELSLEEVALSQQELRRAAAQLGEDNPGAFMTLSFLALPVIPELKLTARGLFDGKNFEEVELVVK